MGTPAAHAPTAHAPEPLEPLGRLAAELSHDLNNQLSAILNYSFVLERQVDPALRVHVRELREAAWRASAMARKLRAIGRPRRGEVTSVALDELFHDLGPVLQHIAGELRVRCDVPASLQSVRGAESALEQLVIALLLAVVARAPDGSTLSVSAVALAPADTARNSAAMMRLDCRCSLPLGDVRPRESWAVSDSTFDRAAMHGVLKNARARMGRDDYSVWADVPIAE